MKDLTPFGARLVWAMKKSKMTDTELAKKLNVATPNIHTLKYKTKKPRQETVKKIAKIFKTNPKKFEIESGKTFWLVVRENGKSKEIRLA